MSRHHFPQQGTHPPTPFKAGFGQLFNPCLVCTWLAGQEVVQRALLTSFGAIVLRGSLKQVGTWHSAKVNPPHFKMLEWM